MQRFPDHEELEGLKPDALLRKAKGLADRMRKMEELVEIISRGKYLWESTFDAITAPVQIVSLDYDIVRANLALAKTSGKEITSIIGRKCYEAFAGRTEPCVGCPLTASLEQEAPMQAPLKNMIGKREFEAHAYPLVAAWPPGSAVLSYRDVTEERRLQREVIQQEKMAAIGMLAGGVAHEINNPLGGILAFAQLMKRDVQGNKRLLDDLEEIEKAAIRCKKIVADLLDFSRISREHERTEVDVNVLLEKVLPFIQREMRSLNVELKFRSLSKIPLIVANPDKLQQVFLNLMTNACHAMSKGGSLTVITDAEEDGRMVVVHVRDTGVGMAPDICDRIFDPFFTTKEPGKGTGLGLSISYRIIKDLGGDLSCESEEGVGSQFTVRLPALGMEQAVEDD